MKCHSNGDAYGEPQKGESGFGRQLEPASARQMHPKQPQNSQTSLGRCLSPGQSEGRALGRREEKGGFVSAAQSVVSCPPNPADKEQKAADARE